VKKIAILLVVWLAFTASLHPQDDREFRRSECMDACMRERPNQELQRQEVIALEKETARAIQLGDSTFFRRVYSDDFSGVLSHGDMVNKAGLIAAVQAPDFKYESFTASDVKVRLYRDLAVATGSWSIRGIGKGQPISGQMRVMHVYLYSGGGYHVVSGQNTLLPPYFQQPL
jgi:ketosteroid isomerase-like protein